MHVNTVHMVRSVLCKPQWSDAIRDVVWKTDDGLFMSDMELQSITNAVVHHLQETQALAAYC